MAILFSAGVYRLDIPSTVPGQALAAVSHLGPDFFRRIEGKDVLVLDPPWEQRYAFKSFSTLHVPYRNTPALPGSGIHPKP